MPECGACGALSTAGSTHCSRCGSALARSTTRPGANDETVAAPPSSAPSRITSTSSVIAEEGRLLPGTLIAGRYRVIGLLGRGGMGEVYRATDLTLGLSVALKFLPGDAAANEHLLERFHNEVRTARQVSHPNVCRVYDIGAADGLPFISMEYVDGEDLASLLHRIGRLPAAKALDIMRRICAGLAAAHERGIIHRDLKPHNVMLNKRGEVVIMDFGLAAIADQLEGLEAKNGTPAYMSPEQLRGDSVTARSDIYSLGLIAYELFTGKRAFEARSVVDLLRAEEAAPPPGIGSLVSDVDPAVDQAVLRCLEPDPARRPPSALAVAAALPGGDPLSAALAAGQTPSPELVAAAGNVGGFPPRVAAACLVCVLAVLALLPVIGQTTSLLAISPLDFPPPVLEQKARDMAAAFGYAAKPADWSSRFEYDSRELEYFETHRGSRTWQQVFAAAPPAEFLYRQSPRYLIAEPRGAVTADNPPLTEHGMVNVVLDSRGKLREFRGVAPGSRPGAAPIDAADVFRAAGLDLSQFRETAPAYAPPLAFDARRAWTGAWPGLPDVPVTVEMATWQGALVSFSLRWPWTTPEGVRPQGSPRETAFTAFYVIFLITALICAIVFARRNLRLGRGDRKGAMRVAAATFTFAFVAVVLGAHIVPQLAVFGFLFEAAGGGFVTAAILWLLFLSIEPAIRARWPHSLVAWNRLLAGGGSDARVGSHLLLGVALGMVFLSAFLVREHWLFSAGASPAEPSALLLGGFRPMLILILNRASSALLWGSVVFFLLCGARALVRRDWLAAILAALLMTFVEGSVRHSSHLAVDIPLFLGFYTAFSLLLLRVGLLPTVIAIFVLNVAGEAPISGDFSAWYNWETVVQLGLVAAIAVYGYYRSRARTA